MVKTLIALSVLLFIENLLLMFVSMAQGQYYVRGFLIINMLLIAAFSPKLFALGPMVSNYGNVFYAAVFCAQCITLRRLGFAAAVANLWPVLFALAVYYILTGVLALAPSALEQDALSSAVDLLTAHQLSVVVASGLAFVMAQGFLLDVGRRYTAWWGLPLAVVVGQFIDSGIFFPIAFAHLQLDHLVAVVMYGFAAKVVFAVLLLPAYLFARSWPVSH